MELILLRHSRTLFNLERRYCGATDAPLCDEGRLLASETGVDLSVGKIYVSPLKRALETARIKFPNASHIVADDLREMDFGNFEGRTAAELEHDPGYINWLAGSCTGRCPGGESIDEFSSRVCRAFDTVVRDALGQGESRAVLVAHGGTLMAILAKFGSPARPYFDWYVDNCGGYRARLDDVSWAVAPMLFDCEKFERL
jgi:alpha-ribazole phosphatase